MSLTTTPLADAPCPAAIHVVELDDLGQPFRPGAPSRCAWPVVAARLLALGADGRRACVHVGRKEQRRVDRRSKSYVSWLAGR